MDVKYCIPSSLILLVCACFCATSAIYRPDGNSRTKRGFLFQTLGSVLHPLPESANKYTHSQLGFFGNSNNGYEYNKFPYLIGGKGSTASTGLYPNENYPAYPTYQNHRHDSSCSHSINDQYGFQNSYPFPTGSNDQHHHQPYPSPHTHHQSGYPIPAYSPPPYSPNSPQPPHGHFPQPPHGHFPQPPHGTFPQPPHGHFSQSPHGHFPQPPHGTFTKPPHSQYPQHPQPPKTPPYNTNNPQEGTAGQNSPNGQSGNGEDRNQGGNGVTDNIGTNTGSDLGQNTVDNMNPAVGTVDEAINSVFGGPTEADTSGVRKEQPSDAGISGSVNSRPSEVDISGAGKIDVRFGLKRHTRK